MAFGSVYGDLLGRELGSIKLLFGSFGLAADSFDLGTFFPRS